MLRSEDEASEHLVEQDYWAAAIEFADSVGVDVVNTSLGYYTFDDPTKNYRYRDLNGHYALMSREASKAADKVCPQFAVPVILAAAHGRKSLLRAMRECTDCGCY